MGVMTSRLLAGVEALAAQALKTCTPSGVTAVRSMVSRQFQTDEEQVTGLEREAMMAAQKGLDPYNTLAPKAASGTSSGCTKVRPSSAPAVEPITSWCPTAWPTEPLHQLTQNVL